MKIAYGSDIHTEFGNQRALTLPEPVDVLILAGDIGKGADAIEYGASFLGQARHVVQIAGNHEYWKGELDKVIGKMREAAAGHANLHFLELDSVEIEGWHFHGATTWTSFSYGDHGQHLNMWSARQAMNDYKYIKKFTGSVWRKLSPEDILRVNENSKNFLFGALERTDREKSIVVTHHAPCHLSIPEKHKDDALNHSYVNEWGDVIAWKGPRLWFHGHIHDPSDYDLGDTRVLCNPIGYPGQYAETAFKVIEVDS